MSTLLLIRHGQARAFDADSDRLTDLGEEQARLVGEHLVRSGVDIDEAYAGTLVRQRRTLELCRDVFLEAHKAFPVPTFDSGWNEYDAGGILGGLMPVLRTRDPHFGKLVEEFELAAARSDRNRHFQRMFEVLMSAWQRGDIATESVEPFTDFQRRVGAAFEAITSRAAWNPPEIDGRRGAPQKTGGRRTVAVFTSGGPIGVCVQRVLEAAPMTALRLNWRVKNASITEFIFSEGRISLEYFNVVEHLPASHRTFR